MRARQAVEREHQQADSEKVQTAINIGATMVGALLGRKLVSSRTLGRASTAARGMRRSAKEIGDVARARETLAAAEEQLAQLDAELTADTFALRVSLDAATEQIEQVVVRPKRGAVEVQLVALLWKPFA
jgi:hypothetical protein